MGPRIYNVFPTLVGPMSRWTAHFDRIAAMGFDWIYVNPINATGGSGSLYAVADYYALNPLLREPGAAGDDASDADAVAAMVAAARARGLRVMLDLVINHTANDSPLTQAHPGWYLRDAAGTIVSPSAVDPDDPENVTVWGDLAELDFADRSERAEMVRYFSDVARHYARLGVGGFRCDAAYKVPGPVWAEVIAAVRSVEPGAVFAAETLGCTVEEVAQLAPAGFDYLFNSSKWWDFRSNWLLEQYEAFRGIAPSIAFPESHDTPRLAAELHGAPASDVEAHYRFRYLFAAFFSSGVMMPMGYEYGFRKKLDVVTTRPSDWEPSAFDLSAFIADANAMKAAVPALNTEGPQHALPLAGGAVGLFRDAAALAVFNPDATAATVDAGRIARAFGGPPRDVTPHAAAKGALERGERLALEPFEFRIFTRDVDARPGGEAMNPARDARPVVIEGIVPQIDAGKYAVKAVTGEPVTVEADVYREGHDLVSAALLYRAAGAGDWHETPLTPLVNDRYTGSFVAGEPGAHEYAIVAWPDAFATWQHDTERKAQAEQSLALELVEGRALVAAAAERAEGDARTALEAALARIDALPDEERAHAMLDVALGEIVARAPDRSLATTSAPLPLDVDRALARFAAWYELFPRSTSGTANVHGTFADAAERLPAIAAMGFDVVYLPPIHPIGHAFRKGRNNVVGAGSDDPGSPWAIGNADGGHTAIEPQLGTHDDFEAFVAAARANGLEIALDYALQCSPDHPWITEHPEWFAFRPDGTIKYAENPPKKYQDIVNFDWFGPAAPKLWNALRDVVRFWIARGVRIFRVDNPHTKPFAFWDWLIREIRAEHPETLFLAEAFTRPKVMARLAKGGFTQSYTYFTWRNTKAELTEYATQLATTEMADYYRPSFWPNTPDILPPYLQAGGRPAFLVRLTLAATLSSLYGIYSGFELAENAGLAGREEYADSEKYEIKARDYDAPGNLAPQIARLNAIRRAHPALQDWRNVAFYRADDDDVVFYAKRAAGEILFIAVNLDPFAAHDPLLWLPTGELGIGDDEPYDLEELLGGTRHRWTGSPHRWRLDPQLNPAAIFALTLKATS